MKGKKKYRARMEEMKNAEGLKGIREELKRLHEGWPEEIVI